MSGNLIQFISDFTFRRKAMCPCVIADAVSGDPSRDIVITGISVACTMAQRIFFASAIILMLGHITLVYAADIWDSVLIFDAKIILRTMTISESICILNTVRGFVFEGILRMTDGVCLNDGRETMFIVTAFYAKVERGFERAPVIGECGKYC